MAGIRTILPALCLFALMMTNEAAAQSVPVLSRNQVSLTQQIDRFISIRVEPRRTSLAATIAFAVEDDLPKLFQKYFPDTPYALPTKDDTSRRSEVGRLICRLLAEEREQLVAVFTRCDLGNLLVNIMNRNELILVPRGEAIPQTRAMLENAVRRIAYSYRKARGMPPVWIPDPAKTREEVRRIR
jgi:hypothetical protein